MISTWKNLLLVAEPMHQSTSVNVISIIETGRPLRFDGGGVVMVVMAKKIAIRYCNLTTALQLR